LNLSVFLTQSLNVKNPVFLLIFSVFVLGCNKENPIDYNDKIIFPQIRISAYIDSIFTQNAAYTDIVQYRQEIIKNAEQGLEQTRILGDFKGSETYKNTGIEYYSYVKKLFSETADLDSLMFIYNSKERIDQLDEKTKKQMSRDFEYYNNLESRLLDEQQRFIKEFNVHVRHQP